MFADLGVKYFQKYLYANVNTFQFFKYKYFLIYFIQMQILSKSISNSFLNTFKYFKYLIAYMLAYMNILIVKSITQIKWTSKIKDRLFASQVKARWYICL